MNLWYIIGFIPWVIVMITALARLNDIKRSQRQFRWHMRRLGMLGSFLAGVAVICQPFSLGAGWMPVANWLTTGIAISWALTWLTTPNMPPWHKWISGEYRELTEDEQRIVRSAAARGVEVEPPVSVGKQ